MDPSNPEHHRYLESQLRASNGGTPGGRTVRPQSFLKAMSTFLAFIATTKILKARQ